MTETFPSLFSPLKIGSYTLKNRIMNTGHGAQFKTGDGIPTDQYVAYVRERAKGGAGIIVTGHTVPHYDGDHARDVCNYDERITVFYKKFAEATHAYDVPMLAQLGHRGRRPTEAGYLQNRIVSASAVPAPDFSSPQFVPHAMSTAEVEEVVGQFEAAAQRVVRGEMDGVELAVGVDYLFSNFLNAKSNLRDDKYGGGTPEERMTFLNEVIDAVRGALGPDRLLGIRFYDDLVDYSLGLEDYKQMVVRIEAAGKVDYFNMWQGLVASPRSGREHWPSYYSKPGQFAYLPAGLKEATSLPVVGTGRIDSPALADSMVRDGKADIIGMARVLIADPHWPNKAREGRADDIRTCIACTQSCVGHVDLGMGVGCIYNPVTGRELEWSELPPLQAKKKVVVVGGGPAGCEAARIAAERGHEVVLFEKGQRLGGQVNLVMRTPARGIFEEIIIFFERQLGKLAVDVRLQHEVVVEDVLAETPGAVIIATGSTAFCPEVLGADQKHVLSARDVLLGNAEIGQRVLVVDTVGRAEAPTVAEFLADQGREVEIVTGLEWVGRHMPGPAWHNLTEQLLKKGVTLTAFTGVWEVLADSVDVYNVVTWEPRTIADIDTVVIAAGGQADDSLYQDLKEHLSEVHAIGDCYQPRDIELAVIDGHRVAREL